MSTQINVTVGSGGLSDKARQLQTAARQAQLEKERTLSMSAEALDKRVAAQAAKGLSPDGQPLYGTNTAVPQIERRPAASRLGGLDILLVPSQDYNSYGILAKTKKLKNLNFVDSYFQDASGPLLANDRYIFQPTGGPTGTAAALQVPVAATTLGNFCSLEYIVTNNNFVESKGSLPGSGLAVQIASNRIPWQSNITAKDISVFTAEIYIRAGDGKSVPGDSSATCSCRFSFMGFRARIELYQTIVTVPSEPDSRLVYVAFVGGSNITEESLYNVLQAGLPSEYDGGYGVDNATGEYWLYEGGAWSNIGVIVSDTTRNVFNYQLDVADFYSSLNLPDSSRFQLGELQGIWRHLAYVRDQTETRFYMDGRLLGSGVNVPIPGTTAITGSIEGINGRSTSLESAFHGYRVTPKVLYTTNFTAPAAITSFA